MFGSTRWWGLWGGALSAAAALLRAGPCEAQPNKVDGVFALQSGVEGADPGLGQLVWQRARTRLALGAEWFTEESLRESVGLYALIELERSGSFGAEARYRRWVNRWLGGFAGVTAILQPESLLGVTGGVTGTYGLGAKVAAFAELSASAFPIGTDRPQGEAVVVWLSGSLGVRLGL